MLITSSVAEYLQSDHVRLDGLFDRARDRVRAGDFTGASGLFEEFSTGLRRHIRMEEDLLFPAFENATGTGGPTQVMRLEHLEIGGLLDSLGRCLEQTDPGAFEGRAGELLDILGSHNQKEEHVVYPLTDHSLPREQRDELIRRMQAL